MKSNLSTSFWKISFLKKNSSFVIAFTHKIKTLKGKDLDKIILIFSLLLFSKMMLYDLVINSLMVLNRTKIDTVKLRSNSVQ